MDEGAKIPFGPGPEMMFAALATQGALLRALLATHPEPQKLRDLYRKNIDEIANQFTAKKLPTYVDALRELAPDAELWIPNGS